MHQNKNRIEQQLVLSRKAKKLNWISFLNIRTMRTNSRLLNVLLILLSILAIQPRTFADSNKELPSIFDLMNYREVLNITLEVDMELLQMNRRHKEYLTAGLWFEDAQGKDQAWRIKVKERGKFRRMNCAMPPLKLKFKKAQLAVAGLASFNDMKLVTHCIDNASEAKKLLAKEYLAYKLYNQVSPYSYRVQMVRITYKDINTGRKTKQWGFLIEDLAQLRYRIDAQKVESKEIRFDQLKHQQIQLMAVFQYFIGNADWDLQGGRNLKFLKKGRTVIAIPYDFDFSGLVHASYAIPNPNYFLRSTQERVYLGFEERTDELKVSIQALEAQKDQLYRIIRKSKLLSSIEKIKMRQFLNTFFESKERIQFIADKKELSATAP